MILCATTTQSGPGRPGVRIYVYVAHFYQRTQSYLIKGACSLHQTIPTMRRNEAIGWSRDKSCQLHAHLLASLVLVCTPVFLVLATTFYYEHVHMRSKNEMTLQSAFAGSSTPGSRSVTSTVLSVDTYSKYYVTYLQQCQG